MHDIQRVENDLLLPFACVDRLCGWLGGDVMAQRFGGKFSPSDPVNDGAKGRATGQTTAANPYNTKRRTKAGFKSNLLFVLPVPFLWNAFQGPPAALILWMIAAGLLLLGAWLTREGLFAQEAYEARRVARRPALPRKLLAALLIGASLGLGTMLGGQSTLVATAIASLGAFLHLGAFGLDPMANKGAEGIDTFQTDRVAKAVETAESHLAGMKDAILRARDLQLERRVDRFADTARALFRTVEGDPRDLTAARKYLGVYLQGARDATVKFVDLYARNRDPNIRADYEALLTDLETNFASRTTALLSDNHTDLNVEIEVLRERLAFENR